MPAGMEAFFPMVPLTLLSSDRLFSTMQPSPLSSVLVLGGLPAGFVAGPPPAQRFGACDGTGLPGGGLARGRGGVSPG